MLSEDLLYIVLPKLPVKSLLRFRCVSKLWLNLIDSSYLINMHLDHTKRNSSNTMFIPFDLNFRNRATPMYAFDFDNPRRKAKKIRPPVTYSLIHVYTCNGLICSCSIDEKTIIIWNPATHKYRQVPVEVKGCYPYCFGFGYDHKTDDYKVVMLEELIIKEEERRRGFIVHVYSLKTRMWRRIAGTTNEIACPYMSVYASGAMHWMDHYPAATLESLEQTKSRIAAFDLTTEKWEPRTMPPEPRKMPPIGMQGWVLSNHQESLCACSCGDEPHLVSLWVMKKTNCWSKLVTVKQNNGDILTTITPVWSLKKMSRHQILLHNHKELNLYDIDKGTREDFFHVVGVPNVLNFFILYQSLVPV